MTQNEIVIKPQPGPQNTFSECWADIAVMGGAAGVGKSYILLADPLRYIQKVAGFGGVIFRRNSVQVKNEGGLWDEAGKMYPLFDAKSNITERQYTFPPYGNKVTFGHLEHEKSKYSYDGAQIPFIGFDELCHFTEGQFWHLISRNRTMCGVKPYVRATCNPDPDSFVAKLIEWWINQKTGYAYPERSGVVRWFIRIKGKMNWADTKEELLGKFGDDVLPKSFTFIAGLLQDNKILMKQDPMYLSNLEALPLVKREQLLKGNWKIRPAAGLYFKRQYFEIVDSLPEITRECRGWDLAATDPEEKKNPTGKPDWTASVKMSLGIDGILYISDMSYDQLSPGAVRNKVERKAIEDGSECIVRLPQDPGQAGKDQMMSYRNDVVDGYPVKSRSMRGDKITRAGGFSSSCESGKVKLLKGWWNELFISHAEDFPPAIGSPDIIDAGVESHFELKFGLNSNKEAAPVVNVPKEVKDTRNRIAGTPKVENIVYGFGAV
jgi:predicted phage terminase large subunit-like protein